MSFHLKPADDWEYRLADRGCRVTGSRRAVVGVLSDTTVALSTQEIWERAETDHRGLGLVTVYRTLALLEGLGFVRRVHRRDGCHAYLPASPGHSHAVICSACGRAIEFPGGDDVHRLILRVEEFTGFTVESQLLQLSGLCPDCQGPGEGDS